VASPYLFIAGEEKRLEVSRKLNLICRRKFSLSTNISEDFPEFLLKRRLLKNVKKSANIFIKNKKFIIITKKEIIDSNIDLLRKSKLRNMFPNI